MADSIITKLLTALTAKTSADDTDIIPVGSSDSNLFKMTFENLRKALLGDATLNTSAQTIIGAINENKSSINTLNTNLTYSTLSLADTPWIHAYKYGKVVTVHIVDWGVAVTVNSTMATLPSGWRPVYEGAWCNTFDNQVGYVVITTDGSIQLQCSTGATSITYIRATCTFVIP